MKTKLDDETDARHFLDSNKMTLTDCDLLPKLRIALTAAKLRRNFQLPEVRLDRLNSKITILIKEL